MNKSIAFLIRLTGFLLLAGFGSPKQTVAQADSITFEIEDSLASNIQWFSYNPQIMVFELIPGATTRFYRTIESNLFFAQYVTSNNQNASVFTQSVCIEQFVNTPITLQASSKYSGASYEWFLDEQSISGEINSTLEVNSPGEYAVVISTDQCPDYTQIFIIAGLAEPVLDAGNSITICNSDSLMLIDLEAMIIPSPSTSAYWTSSGNGIFDNSGTGVGIFGEDSYYILSSEDKDQITLTLSYDTEGACGSLFDIVTIEILEVDCGSFPWGGN